MEEFLLSAETEGIWGFTKAMEMVGGVSLFIFFSGFKHKKKTPVAMLAALSFNIYPRKYPLKACPQYKHLGNTFLENNKYVIDMSYLFSWPILIVMLSF